MDTLALHESQVNDKSTGVVSNTDSEMKKRGALSAQLGSENESKEQRDNCSQSDQAGEGWRLPSSSQACKSVSVTFVK